MLAVLQSNLKSFGGWNKIHKGKWKTSYVYAAHSKKEQTITREELVNNDWKLYFKRDEMFEATAKFLPNNYYYSEPTFIADLKWEFFGPPTLNNAYEAVKVGKYFERQNFLFFGDSID